MARIPRWRMSDGIYHVYNRSLSSAMTLASDEDKQIFCDLIRKKLSGSTLNIYHYCIMGNHFHLAVEVLDIRELSSFISGLCSSYSKSFRSRHRAGYGPLWQGRYKSAIVQKDNYLFRLGRYIEQNPVQAGLIERAGDWRFSSAHCYLDWKSDGIVFPDRHPMLSTWPENPTDRHRFYLDYLQESTEEDLQIFESDTTVIGDDTFRSKLTTTTGRKQIRRGRPAKNQ